MTQSYYKVPRFIRLNSQYYTIFKIAQAREIRMIHDEIACGQDKNEFIREFAQATTPKFGYWNSFVKSEIK